MIKISGYVLIQNKNVGIPRLVVAAYDAEKTLDEIINDHRSENGFAASLMQHLGYSISSVLTDNDGCFLIDAQDLMFEGNKTRPDLIIIVFAPEDIRDINNPIPWPPEKRILYLSTIPRIKAGAEEAYVIRLLQKQLDEFDIAVPGEEVDSKKIDASIMQYLRNIDSGYVLKENIKEKFAPKIKEQQDRDTRSIKIIEEKSKNLTALPLSLREHPMLLKNLDDLEKYQKKAVEEGLKLFKNYENSIRMNLTNDDLKFFKIKSDKGTTRVKIDTQLLSAKLNELTGGIDLSRKNDLLPSQITPEALYKKYFSKPKKDVKVNKNKKPE